jgi:hypothetical protein
MVIGAHAMKPLWVVGIVASVTVFVLLATLELRSANSRPGWMDDQPFTQEDQQRVAQIGSEGIPDEIFSKATLKDPKIKITKRDLELIRQNYRRARAAYPHIPFSDFVYGVWIKIDLSERILLKFGSPASFTTKINGKTYLDGGDFEYFVKPEYSKRASTEQTKRFVLGHVHKRGCWYF